MRKIHCLKHTFFYFKFDPIIIYLEHFDWIEGRISKNSNFLKICLRKSHKIWEFDKKTFFNLF